ncbi:hypothetical protein C4901_00305 [Acidiferrobacter sp. SPIII_3]|uniref:Uncharacterized protein n=1 Tax=Acidiferrobacter thiooxydans TaxID=163359 RepID=A0A368HFV3_9GAMM|nr:hypothetical protein C4901_00305 [Acidiferrobacter sp. SPIII_3]RCN58272.1 hypothetical protein C4900_00250 [Acidiferrobacter thiooxydans]
MERATRSGCLVRNPRGAAGGRPVGDGGAHGRGGSPAPEFAILRHYHPGSPDGDFSGDLPA